MRNIKLTIEYDGTHFNGWQIQNETERTVQGEIEKALRTIFKKKLRLIGSGRTDTGVHAAGQVAHFKTEATLSTEQILKALNANLPDDVVILKVEKVPAAFHTQYSAKSKEYCYTILNRVAPSALSRNFCLHVPKPLNIKLMRSEAKSFIGKKDFRSFAATDAERLKRDYSTVRTIKKLNIKQNGDFITIEVEADGFLYKMVRNIVGCLLEIGQGRLPKGSVNKILAQKSRTAVFKTARARGLSLVSVNY